jgi:tRNA (adenine57-N1/adenine58-N1)-methyltransferase
LICIEKNAYEGIDLLDDQVPFDRVVLDLPEPWQVVPHAMKALRSGGIYLSFVPTVPQVMRTVEALERTSVFGMIETFETLLRTWSVRGRSVRPDHRMVAHSGFITVARKVESGLLGPMSHIGTPADRDQDSTQEEADEAGEDESYE